MTAGTKEKLIKRMLRSQHSADISDFRQVLKTKFTSKDKHFDLPPMWSERLSRKEDNLPIMFADYKDNFPFVDRFDFFMEQVRLLLVFMKGNQRFIQSYLWMGAVNAWLLHVDSMCSPRLPLSKQKAHISLRKFFSMIGKLMIVDHAQFSKVV